MNKGQLLKHFRKSNEGKVYFYDNCNGSVILNNIDATLKIEEQIGDSVVSNTDTTSALTGKKQKHLETLRKQTKVWN